MEDHFASLKLIQRYRLATLTPVPNGTFVVEIPAFPLPDGWNARSTTVYFIVPVGYPVAKPDTFWTSPDLRLAGGGMPNGTNQQNPPGIPPDLLWFSWHPSVWNPNRDSLINYAEVIAQRFREAR